MARARTLTNLIADCRQRAGMENSTFVSDAEITEYLNQELAELWCRICANDGQPHYRSSTTYSVTPSTSIFALPADFWRAQEVNATMNGFTFPIRPFMAAEHGYLQNATLITTTTAALHYRVQADNIEFLPNTQSFTATLYYVPSQPRLVSGSDTFDGFNGYEVAAIHGTVAQMLAKEQSDPSFALSQKERIVKLVQDLSASRDEGATERVQDVVGSVRFWSIATGWLP